MENTSCIVFACIGFATTYTGGFGHTRGRVGKHFSLKLPTRTCVYSLRLGESRFGMEGLFMWNSIPLAVVSAETKNETKVNLICI